MTKFRYIIAIIFALVFFSACNRVIPKQKMVDIYVDIFLLDQWLVENDSLKVRADTTLFYDEIFMRHGVSFEEFNEAIYYYTGEIDTFAEIVDEAAKRLDLLTVEKQTIYDQDVKNHQTNVLNTVVYQRGKFPLDSASIAPKLNFWPSINVPQKEYFFLKIGQTLPKKKALKTENKLLKDE